MKKTISIYTPQEKMPKCDTRLLIESCEYGTIMAYYLGNDIWENEDGSEAYYKTDDVSWWLDLEKLNTSIGLNLMKAVWEEEKDNGAQ